MFPAYSLLSLISAKIRGRLYATGQLLVSWDDVISRVFFLLLSLLVQKILGCHQFPDSGLHLSRELVAVELGALHAISP